MAAADGRSGARDFVRAGAALFVCFCASGAFASGAFVCFGGVVDGLVGVGEGVFDGACGRGAFWLAGAEAPFVGSALASPWVCSCAEPSARTRSAESLP